MSWDGSLPIDAAQVRAYLDVTGTSGAYSDAIITSNIRAAAAFIERETGRQFENQPATTKTFTTNGAGSVDIPDARVITSVTLQGATLDLDASYWKITDNKGAYTTIQLRPFGSRTGSGYLANPQWFDRNLDRDYFRYGYTSLPNDLVVVGDFGYNPYPHDFLLAVKVLAGWYTRRPASLLANAAATPEGNFLQYGELPPEVTAFITSWKLGGPVVVSIG